MGKIFKKISAVAIAMTLALSALPLQSINAEEVSKYSVTKIDKAEYGLESLKDAAQHKAFLDVFEGDPRDTISVIVELEDAPVIERTVRGVSSYSVNQETSKLESKQESVIEEIQALDETTQVNDQFTYLTNSIAVDIKAESFDAVKSIGGVKRVFVEREYYLPEPQMSTSNGIVNAPNVWNNLGYKGEGMTVAVLDTGLDTTHEAFQITPDSPKYSQQDVVDVLTQAGDLVHADVSDYSELYHNEKVPFTYDYAMDKVSVSPDASNASKISHGTHVAGTVAGNNGSNFKGVAPEAQVLVFKVFDNAAGGATDRVIMAALEDAVLMNVDAINMSLGSDAGFTVEADDYTNDLYSRIKDAGILISASAGNAHSAGSKNVWQLDSSLSKDPDHGIVGSPSTYNGPLSIASSENTQYVTSVIKVGSESYTYVNTDNSIKQIVGVHDFVSVPNTGTAEDYVGLDVQGKVVFVSRGDISFPEKMNFAADAGAVGIIIYGTDDSLINMSAEGATLPAAYIVKSAYEAIAASGETQVDISDEEVIQPNPSAHLPSDFSSMGTTSTLNIKPEITAPGGQIYSTLPSQGESPYGMMSGTSMAAPHVAGGAALVKQYINEKFPTLNAQEIVALMDNLLMSTTNIIKYTDDEGEVRVAPVRQQGAGVMDLEKAIKAEAYLHVDASQNDDGSTRPKLELKDSASGEFTVNFKVTNFSVNPQTYDVNVISTLPELIGYNYGGPIGVKLFMSDENLVFNSKTTAPASITVAAGATEEVSFTISFDDAELEENYSEFFENGYYHEGFVELVNQDSTKEDLSIPFLGFVGDWSKASIFDHANDNDIEFNGELPSLQGHVLGSKFQTSLVNLGVSVFHEDPQDMAADYSNLVVSPNGDGIFEDLDTVILGQLRNAKTLNLVVKDKDGNVLEKQERENAFKSFYHGSYGQIVTFTHFVGNGFDPVSFDAYEDGEYTLEFVANLGYKDSADQVLSYTIKVDRQEPELVALSADDNKVNFTLKDETKLLYSEVNLVKVTEAGIVNQGVVSSQHTPYGANEDHDFEISGLEGLTGPYAFIVSTIDAGYNEATYLVSPEELVVVEDQKWVVKVNDVRNIVSMGHPFVNPTFTSEDETIATVTADGEVTAVAVGVTTVKVEDATGNYNIEVHVVEHALTSDQAEYTVGRNEQVTLSLAYLEEAIDAGDAAVTYTYDTEALKIEAGVVTGLKAGSHTVNVSYELASSDVLDATETFTTTLIVNVIELDKTALQLIVDNYVPVNADVYSAESIAALEAAVEAGKVVLASEDVTQAEIDAALLAIQNAKAGLKQAVRGLEDSYEVTQEQSVVVNPTPVTGTWAYDQSALKIERSGNGYRITGLKAGVTSATFTNEDGESKTISITVKAKSTDPKEPVNPPVKPPVTDGGKETPNQGSGNQGPNTGIETQRTQPYAAVLFAGLAVVGLLIVTHKKTKEEY